LSTFTFGETTPTIQHIKAFELSDGTPFGRRPIAWSSIWSPPPGLENMSTYQVVLELDLQSHLEDFLMVFQAKVGSGRLVYTLELVTLWSYLEEFVMVFQAKVSSGRLVYVH
jgi:hypothetical protein